MSLASSPAARSTRGFGVATLSLLSQSLPVPERRAALVAAATDRGFSAHDLANPAARIGQALAAALAGAGLETPPDLEDATSDGLAAGVRAAADLPLPVQADLHTRLGDLLTLHAEIQILHAQVETPRLRALRELGALWRMMAERARTDTYPEDLANDVATGLAQAFAPDLPDVPGPA